MRQSGLYTQKWKALQYTTSPSFLQLSLHLECVRREDFKHTFRGSGSLYGISNIFHLRVLFMLVFLTGMTPMEEPYSWFEKQINLLEKAWKYKPSLRFWGFLWAYGPFGHLKVGSLNNWNSGSTSEEVITHPTLR